MTERLIFSTRELVPSSVQKLEPQALDLGEEVTLFDERVWFGKDSWADANMMRRRNPDSLKWVDNMVICLNKGVCFYYDHKYWAQPFGTGFQPPELKGLYPAVIHFSSASRGSDDRVRFAVTYGTFWYDENGVLTAIKGGHITHSDFEFNTPFINLRRVDKNNWRIYRMGDIFEYTYTRFLKGCQKLPEDKLLTDGEEIVVDEIVSSIGDSGRVVRFEQKTLTGHKRKVIEVPSVIDLERWGHLLDQVDGEWIKVLTEFPSRIEVVS